MKMNKLKFIIILAVLTCISSVFIYSCKEDEKLFAGLNSSEVTIVLGETYQFHLDLVATGDASTSGITASWGVSDESVATVDQTGLVSALQVGSTVVTATLSNGQYVTSLVTVIKPEILQFQLINEADKTDKENVTEVFYYPDQVPSSETTVYISLAKDVADLGDSIRFTIEDPEYVLFADKDKPEIQFPDTLISVDADTLALRFKPLVEGETRLKVCPTNNELLDTYLTIHVGPVVTLSWQRGSTIVSSSKRIFLQDGETELVAYTSVSPASEAEREGLYEYEVLQEDEENPAALIEDFVQEDDRILWTIKPQSLGTTRMTVKSRGSELTFMVNVVDKNEVTVNALQINYLDQQVAYQSLDGSESYSGEVEISTAFKTATFQAVTDPLNASSTWPVEWTSSNPDVAEYTPGDNSSVGTFQLKTDGETEISATSGSTEVEGARVTAKFKLIVKTAITAQVASGNRSTLMVGETSQYSYTVTPAGMSTDVIWHSSNAEVATFDEDGVLHALSVGQTEVTVEAVASGAISEPFTVTVVEALEDYSYTGRQYLYTFMSGDLQIQAADADGVTTSRLYLTLDSKTLEDGVYTVGSNMSDVRFEYGGKTGYVTSGTLTVSDGGDYKNFDIDLLIDLETEDVSLSGNLQSENCVGGE